MTRRISTADIDRGVLDEAGAYGWEYLEVDEVDQLRDYLAALARKRREEDSSTMPRKRQR